jgi:hypothetical protein
MSSPVIRKNLCARADVVSQSIHVLIMTQERQSKSNNLKRLRKR